MATGEYFVRGIMLDLYLWIELDLLKNITYPQNPKNFLKGAFPSSLIHTNNLVPFFEYYFGIGTSDPPQLVMFLKQSFKVYNEVGFFLSPFFLCFC